MPIVWQRLDGAVELTQFTEEFLARERRPDETTAQAVLRLAVEHVQMKVPRLAGIVPALVRSADVPKDRNRRHVWRLNGTVVVADPTVPDPPHPKQALLDAIGAASDLASLKAALKGLLR